MNDLQRSFCKNVILSVESRLNRSFKSKSKISDKYWKAAYLNRGGE